MAVFDQFLWNFFANFSETWHYYTQLQLLSGIICMVWLVFHSGKLNWSEYSRDNMNINVLKGTQGMPSFSVVSILSDPRFKQRKEGCHNLVVLSLITQVNSYKNFGPTILFWLNKKMTSLFLHHVRFLCYCVPPFSCKMRIYKEK